MKRILVQAGHVAPREPGFEAGTGTVREQEYTYAMRKRVVSLLEADDRFDPVPVPGDIPDGIKVNGAIFLHADGSASSASTGCSFGFPNYQANKRLAGLIWEEYKKIPGHPPHHSDNYTGGLREYYGYRRVQTADSEPEVLFEVGFMTNPSEQKWIFAHLNEIARAIYTALCRYWNFLPRGVIQPARLGWIVVWTDKAGVEHRKRTLTPRRLFLRLWADGIRRRIIVRREVPIPESG